MHELTSDTTPSTRARPRRTSQQFSNIGHALLTMFSYALGASPAGTGAKPLALLLPICACNRWLSCVFACAPTPAPTYAVVT